MKTKFIFSIVLVAICYFSTIQTSSAQKKDADWWTTYSVSIPNAPSGMDLSGKFIEIIHKSNDGSWSYSGGKHYFTSNSIPSFNVHTKFFGSAHVQINTNLDLSLFHVPVIAYPTTIGSFRCYTISYIPNGIVPDPCEGL